MNPVVKWAGGKRQLLADILKNLPKDVIEAKGKGHVFAEPFLGGAAVLLHLLEEYDFDKYIASDINERLIIMYNTIKDSPEELIDLLDKKTKKYLPLEHEDRQKMYYDIREKFNRFTEFSNVEVASMFIFLNKTCFNGLYRENKKGGFNVPIGRYKQPTIFSSEHIYSMSKLFNEKNVEFINSKYADLSYPDNTLIYMDPPFRPITEGGFNSYNKSGFNDKDQTDLSEHLRKVSCRFMLSNSDPKNLDINDMFFDDLYKGFNIRRVIANRNISSNGEGRRLVTELLVKNY